MNLCEEVCGDRAKKLIMWTAHEATCIKFLIINSSVYDD